MDLGLQHMFNESQSSNVPMNNSTGMINGNGSGGSGSGSGTNNNYSNNRNGVNIGSPTGAGYAVRTTINDDQNHNKNIDLGNRKRMINKAPSHVLNNSYSRNLDEWINNTNGSINPYQKSLDEWLNTTMKESPKPFSTSSTEFLDTNRAAAINGINSANAIMANAFRLIPELENTMPFGQNQNTFFNASGYPTYGSKMPQQHGTDFTSLPPGVNLSHDKQETGSQNDLLDGLENRRFSDPCLANNSDEEGAQRNTDKLNLKNQSDNNKLLATLIQQINYLHETNSKICRNLNDTKVDIEALKHAPSWGLRHRRDSVSGFSTHSQPIGYGTHSPAPTYHSGMYTPGMMTDVVREVKEAARVREEALLSRVRSMVEERSWTMSEIHLKLIRDMEELRVQVNQLKIEKVEMKNHVSKLEDEIKSLRSLLSHSLNFGRTNQMLTATNTFNHDRGFLRASPGLRNSPSDKQKRHSFSLNYGTINQEEAGLNSPLFHNETDILQPMQDQFNELLKGEKLKYGLKGGKTDDMHGTNKLQNGHYISSDNDGNDGQLLQMEKDNLELRRELQDALANKKHADNKIQALESLVKNLQTKIPSDQNNLITITTHSSARNSSDNKMLPSTIPPQIAAQIQSLKSPSIHNGKSKINLTGPVTDL